VTNGYPRLNLSDIIKIAIPSANAQPEDNAHVIIFEKQYFVIPFLIIVGLIY
jgi:hypothetical protein